MRAGILRDRIIIQHKTVTADGWGQEIEVWSDLATVWANVRFMSGKEYISANRETAQIQASIRIRIRSVDSGMRVIFNGKVYEITSVLPNSKAAYIDLVVKEIV